MNSSKKSHVSSQVQEIRKKEKTVRTKMLRQTSAEQYTKRKPHAVNMCYNMKYIKRMFMDHEKCSPSRGSL